MRDRKKTNVFMSIVLALVLSLTACADTDDDTGGDDPGNGATTTTTLP